MRQVNASFAMSAFAILDRLPETPQQRSLSLTFTSGIFLVVCLLTAYVPVYIIVAIDRSIFYSFVVTVSLSST